jgi:hypothetical protein
VSLFFWISSLPKNPWSGDYFPIASSKVGISGDKKLIGTLCGPKKRSFFVVGCGPVQDLPESAPVPIETHRGQAEKHHHPCIQLGHRGYR